MPRHSVSTKNTKQEILSAYEQLTKELEKSDQQSDLLTLDTKKESSKESVAQKPEQIISRLGELRVAINKNLGEIVDNLVEESERLQVMKEEENLIRKEIEVMHQIKVHASTLQNLLQLKEKEEKELETAIAMKKSEWKQEQDQYEKEQKELQMEHMKEKKRDEEEYEYNLKMKRQKEEDEYKEKRKQTEAELMKRTQDLTQKEEEFKHLQKQVIELEKKLETEVAKTRKETEDRVTKDLKITYNLEHKEIEGERKIQKLTVENLQKTIDAQDTEIKDLKQQLVRATQQIKDIAVSVIDSKKPIIVSQSNKEEKQ